MTRITDNSGTKKNEYFQICPKIVGRQGRGPITQTGEITIKTSKPNPLLLLIAKTIICLVSFAASAQNHHYRWTDWLTLNDGRSIGIQFSFRKGDNSSKFISKVLDHWAYEYNVMPDFCRPGKQTGNAFMESLNGSFRDECLNVNWFMSLDDAMEKIQAFKDDYNDFRSPSALCGLTPNEAVLRHHETRNSLL